MARPTSEPAPRAVSVKQLMDHGGLSSLLSIRAGESGLDRLVEHPRIQKSGLVLVGHSHGVVASRIQVFGETEMSFLRTLADERLPETLAVLFGMQVCCVVVTRGSDLPPAMLALADETGTPVLASTQRSSHTINAIHASLDELLAPTLTVHGVLVDVYDVGVLLRGPSGIGKSECALFLVERGHRLVADDQVILSMRPSGVIEGRPPDALKYHLEVRGIGVLNIRDLFGATAVREDKTVDLLVELCPWDREEEYERLGIDDQTRRVLGTAMPTLRIPVTPGRDMGVILEVAARHHLIKRRGQNPALRFARALSEGLGVALPDGPAGKGEP